MLARGVTIASLSLLSLACFKSFELGERGEGGQGGGVAPSGACDQARPGPAMVPVPPVDPLFCMDGTEVSNNQYGAWLATSPPAPNADALCAWKTGPTSGTADAFDDKPIVEVDWCDARAYCAWAGKRLCGQLGGGAVDIPADSKTDQHLGEWYFACSLDGSRLFPYGERFDITRCNGRPARGGGKSNDVGTTPGCEEPYPGLFDLSGNVWEFQDSCEIPPAPPPPARPTDPRNHACRLLGGSYGDDPAYLPCRVDESLFLTYPGGCASPTLGGTCGIRALHATTTSAVGRGDKLANVGLRCCADPAP